MAVSHFRAVMLVVLGSATTPMQALAQEACHSYGTQYGDFRICVSSVLPPQGKNTYGPDHLNGASDGAWCEGAPGAGQGESVTFHQKPANMIGTVMVINGYAKTERTFRDNGRVKRVRIETSGGDRRDVTLQDHRRPQAIKLKPARVAWIRLTIVDVYPGARHQDTCISMVSPGIEEFALK